MISALIYFVVVALVAYIVFIILQRLFPQLPMEIVGLILGLIVLLAALRIFGVWGGGSPVLMFGTLRGFISLL